MHKICQQGERVTAKACTKWMTIDSKELTTKYYYILSTPESILAIRNEELGDCLLAWQKGYNAELYLKEIVPLTDIKTEYSITKIKFGDLVIEAMESKSSIIIDELPNEAWSEHIDIKDWIKNYPKDIRGIKILMTNEKQKDVLREKSIGLTNISSEIEINSMDSVPF